MARILSISGLILISGICYGQNLEKTQTAKQITIKQDTIRRKIVSQQVFKFRPDTVYFKEQERLRKQMDSILAKKKIK